MIEFTEFSINELQYIANYLVQNKNNIGQIISDFGYLQSNNGYGTIFLRPKNPIFKIIWIYYDIDKVKSIGIGGEKLELSLKDLFTVYTKYKEGFSSYDNEYIYVFYSGDNYDYTIKITSKTKLLEKAEIIEDVPINAFDITLK